MRRLNVVAGVSWALHAPPQGDLDDWRFVGRRVLIIAGVWLGIELWFWATQIAVYPRFLWATMIAVLVATGFGADEAIRKFERAMNTRMDVYIRHGELITPPSSDGLGGIVVGTGIGYLLIAAFVAIPIALLLKFLRMNIAGL